MPIIFRIVIACMFVAPLLADEPARKSAFLPHSGGGVAVEIPPGWNVRQPPTGSNRQWIRLTSPSGVELSIGPATNNDWTASTPDESKNLVVTLNELRLKTSVFPVTVVAQHETVFGRVGYAVHTSKANPGVAASPKGFRHATDGALLVNKMLFTFTLLTQDLQSEDYAAGLDVLLDGIQPRFFEKSNAVPQDGG
ncbi:hypothetical protein Poly51_63270 [Rubripirellula tenax]|uniref:Uncharacterized protein n=1 Tax=Rubripirellula tenax TaxID=2528015 RepID=A0A5C6E6H9_9BACT|nr:hypothetical protein [Rubripirellula tenax]TWU43567.1 hypothetical protein Poly51_63270 [Rubripirellula tenax]